MFRPAARLFLLFCGFALLAGLFGPAARASGPALTAKLGLAGRYRLGGWCLVTVGVTNPGPDTISGQVQVLTAGDDNAQPGFGRRGMRSPAPPAVFARPVSVPGGTAAPRTFAVYVRGIDPAQGDLTVQLVEGHARGDGRVLAKISTQDPNQAAAFTGSPISGSDRLLIGFGGDLGAFSFLNGLHNLAAPSSLNASNAGAQGSGMQAAVQVSALSAADLPDRAAGYDGVDSFLLRDDAPLEALTEAQVEALKAWIAGGGQLIVCGGPDPSRFSSAFFTGLLPVTVGPNLTKVDPFAGSRLLILTPKPLPGVHLLPIVSSGKVQCFLGPYGAGTVVMTTFDPTGVNYRDSLADVLPPTWEYLLASRTEQGSSALALTASNEENVNPYNGGGGARLSEAVIRGPSLDAPGTGVIAIFLLVYLVILVPVNYLVLKRLDRKEWAWATIPALVLLFAAGTFGVGYAAKGGSVFVNRAALVETYSGQSQAGVYSEVGLFSPHRASYDIELPGNNLVAAVPNPRPYFGGQSSGNTSAMGGAQFVETQSGVSLLNTPVNMWAMRAFDSQSTTDLGGAIDGSLSEKNGALVGPLVNHTPYALTDCAVCYNGRWQSVGLLAPGATLSLPSSASGSGPQPALPLPFEPENAPGNIHGRMQSALGGYFRSLGQAEPPMNSGSNAHAGFAPAAGEAVLVGWSRDPKLVGPSPKIDGSSVAENDVSLVIVHVPVKPSLYSPPPPVLPHPD